MTKIATKKPRARRRRAPKRRNQPRSSARPHIIIDDLGPSPVSNPSVTPRHQWTNDGAEVLILKYVSKCGRTHDGFLWPLTVGAQVTAPDWDINPRCGGGLHGWPWGFSIGDGKEPEWPETWLVFGAAPGDVIDINDEGGKVKARTGIIRYVGDWASATAFVLAGQMAWVHHASRGVASATGERGVASATGWSGVASATGWSGAASATGWRGAASATGWRGAASATGESGAASATGERGAAVVTGLDGCVRGGPFGVVALAWHNHAADRVEMLCARVGVGDGSDGLLLAGVWYRLSDQGAFIRDLVLSPLEPEA